MAVAAVGVNAKAGPARTHRAIVREDDDATTVGGGAVVGGSSGADDDFRPAVSVNVGNGGGGLDVLRAGIHAKSRRRIHRPQNHPIVAHRHHVPLVGSNHDIRVAIPIDVRQGRGAFLTVLRAVVTRATVGGQVHRPFRRGDAPIHLCRVRKTGGRIPEGGNGDEGQYKEQDTRMRHG